MELRPNRNISESVLHDRRSINFLKSFLPDDCVDCSQLQDGGTLPNIDGYLEILDKHGIAQEKIIVQVKHLTYPEENGKVFYDIPESVYAYAEIHKGELVFFIACDYASRKFYWRNIDTTAIEEFKNKSDRIRTKARYYYSESYESLRTGKISIGCSKIYCCEILHSQSFLYKLYISDTHPFNVFLKDTGEMTSIMAPALSNLIIKSNVGARNNSKSAYSSLFSSNFWL